ncbi:STAS domain-containing protein [Tumidithrix elongata RA019]|uniref:Anti-sigma factor antagonist n=1 Tax=Tumidithrix elongata BACA0141 TaxID=2716417 RepID=A0AAW9Q1G6_9CYAN|nr:STAS domain-containing protein [Tumidithrix elongata RA019]
MSQSVQVLEPEGIIDTSGGNKIRSGVNTFLDLGAKWILIDLKNITFMDSAGLRAIVAIQQLVRAKGAKLYLCSLEDQLQIALELAKMENFFEILPDRAAFDRLLEN